MNRGTGFVGEGPAECKLLKKARKFDLTDTKELKLSENWEHTYDSAKDLLEDFEVYDSFSLYALCKRIG